MGTSFWANASESPEARNAGTNTRSAPAAATAAVVSARRRASGFWSSSSATTRQATSATVEARQPIASAAASPARTARSVRSSHAAVSRSARAQRKSTVDVAAMRNHGLATTTAVTRPARPTPSWRRSAASAAAQPMAASSEPRFAPTVPAICSSRPTPVSCTGAPGARDGV